MLVLDLADHGLDQVLDGDQPVDPAVFVDHQRHVHALLLHLLQENARRHRRRRVKDGAQQPLQAETAGLAEAVLQRKVLEQDKTLRMVQRALVDRHAAETMLPEDLDQLILADVHGHRDDLGLRDGDVVDAQTAQGRQPGLAPATVPAAATLFSAGTSAPPAVKATEAAPESPVTGPRPPRPCRNLWRPRRRSRPVAATAHRSFVRKTPVLRMRL